MKALSWFNKTWVLALAVGLAGAACAAKQSNVVNKGELPPPNKQTVTSLANPPDAASKATVQATYGKLPLSFEANQGQTDEQVQFLSRGSGYTLFLTASEAVLSLRRKAEGGKPKAGETSDSKLRTPNSALTLRMQLVGANPNPHVAGLEELPGKVNYFRGSDPQKWRTDIPTYAKVRYQDVYPGVDLVYYGNQRQLEYDFVVAPGADPTTIRLGFAGVVGAQHAAPLQIGTDGDLVLHTAGGEVRFLKPQIYQETDGIKQPIEGRYVLFRSQTPNSGLTDSGLKEVGFEVAAYDTSKPLVIDPVLSYSTYLGGSSSDSGESIAVDTSGNAYVTGGTLSTNFPTASPLQAASGGGYDVFVAKVNATGSFLLYSTYLGGSDEDSGWAIAVDTSGNAYVTGGTLSTNFPTASPLQAASGGGYDVFVAKVNATGSLLLYSTYLGGSDRDRGYGIAVDACANAYVTGETFSTNFPTASPLQAAFGGGIADAFVAKISEDSCNMTVEPITAPVNPVQVNSTVNTSADFTDSDPLSTHTAVWNWGDSSTSPGIVDDIAGSVSGSHVYTTAGVYTVTLTVTNQDGCCSGQAVFQFVVVYDPNAGFVTGGGWIDSPEGAYTPDSSLTGKANFGFVSKYQKGASVPTGQTEFQFRVANLNFHSTSYQWLVIAGSHAKYKGSGTINGSGDYGFLLTATDGQVNGGGGIDKFRIKIWDKSNGDAVVYDNQLNDPDDGEATDAIEGGSIVIHK